MAQVVERKHISRLDLQALPGCNTFAVYLRWRVSTSDRNDRIVGKLQFWTEIGGFQNCRVFLVPHEIISNAIRKCIHSAGGRHPYGIHTEAALVLDRR